MEVTNNKSNIIEDYQGSPIDTSGTIAIQQVVEINLLQDPPPPLSLNQRSAKWLSLNSSVTLGDLKGYFREKPIITEFACVIHCYVQTLLPNALTSLFLKLPEFGKNLAYYKLSSGVTGPAFVYGARQVESHTAVWSLLTESEEVKKAAQHYAWISSNISAYLGRSLSSVLNVEKLILIACKKITEKPGNLVLKKKLMARAAMSLKLSLSTAKEQRMCRDHQGIDPMLSCLLFWEDKGERPKAFPGSSDFAAGQFYQALQASKSAYIEELAESLVKKLIPERWRSGFASALKEGILPIAYDLEGHAALVKLMKILIGGCAIELVADPMQVVINTLFVFGLPTADLEPDGFGVGKREDILKAGSEMMRLFIQDKPCGQILEPYQRQSFKQGPLVRDEVEQKMAAKQELKTLLKRIIQDQERTNIQGRSLVNYFLYLLRSSGLSEALISTFLDEVVQFLFDPNWPFIIYGLVEDLVDELRTEKTVIDEQSVKESIKGVMVNLYEELIEKVPLIGNVVGLKDGVIGTLVENCYAGFEGNSAGEGNPKTWQEGLLDSVTPTVQEVILSLKVLNAFREKGILFASDAKFFEIYVRETISQIVSEDGLSTPGAISAKRRETVQALLGYEVHQLIRYLISEEEDAGGDFVVINNGVRNRRHRVGTETISNKKNN